MEKPMLDPSKPNYGGRDVFWLSESSVQEADMELGSKVFFALDGVKLFPFDRVYMQFWRPVTGDRTLLEAKTNMYAISPFNRTLQEKYRTACIKYQYSVINPDQPKPAWILSGGPIATAFLNRFPEVVLDLTALSHASPLAACALECGLTSCVGLPVFNTTASSSDQCLGVIECSVKDPALLLPLVNEIKCQLEKADLSICYIPETYKTVFSAGFPPAAEAEISHSLQRAMASGSITLGQVWIWTPGQSEYLLKLAGHSASASSSDDNDHLKGFYDTLNVIPVKTVAGLPSRALGTRQPHLCINLSKLRDDGGVPALLSANPSSKRASFVICLRSEHTGDGVDYLFEFFWPRNNRNHLSILKTLLSTLRTHLPSFKLASGDQLDGDSISVAVIESSSSTTPIPPLVITRTSVAGDKRKLSDLNAGPSGADQQYSVNNNTLTNLEDEDDDDDDDDHELAIFATYRHETLLFYLPCSSTLDNLMEKLREEFVAMELPRTPCMVRYKVSPGQWSSLTPFESCCQRRGPLKLHVPSTIKEVAWRWKTN